MNMKEIRSLAVEMGLKPGKLTKVPLVRTLQKHEGNFDCFATATDGFCDQGLCAWRDDCLKLAVKEDAA
jgi:hypothetical protein